MVAITTISMINASIENVFPASKLTTPKINPIPATIITKLRAHFFLENKAPAIVA